MSKYVDNDWSTRRAEKAGSVARLGFRVAFLLFGFTGSGVRARGSDLEGRC